MQEQIEMFAAPKRTVPTQETSTRKHLHAQTARPYQIAAVKAIERRLQEDRSTLLVLPTGGGKTFVFTDLIRRRPTDRVLVLAHRDELLQQAQARLAKELGEPIGLEQAQNHHDNERVIVGSIQTVSMPNRLEAFSPEAFDLIVCDEAHHAVAPTWRRVVDYFANAKVLGVTATPDRADEKAMGQVFDSVAFDYEIEDAIRDGWLCDVTCTRVRIAGLDLSNVRTTAGDLNQGDLETAMKVEGVLQGIADVVYRESGDRKTLVFATSVEGAHRLAEILCRHREGCAVAVDGKTEIDERRERLNSHQDGGCQFLVNVGICTEGYDDPSISCVAVARPTKSRALFAQMIGRGLRIAPGKTDCLVIDLAGNSGRHKLASAADILGGKYSEGEVAEANRQIAKNPGMRAVDALEAAKAKLERDRLAAEAIARRKGIVAKAIYTKSPAELFRTLGMQMPSDIEAAGRFGGKPPSDKQIEYLNTLRMPIPNGITAQIASALIAEAKRRRAENLASAKQVGCLSRYGIDANTMDRGVAGKMMEFLKGRNWAVSSEVAIRHLRSIDGSDF